MLAACGGGGDKEALASAPAAPITNGPAADYPVVLGEPFTVEGLTYTPQDKLNYDEVGYAGTGEGDGVSIAHRTLPLPSYAEVTSLETGKTILVRVTRRGPMTGAQLVELSPLAATQLGVKAARTPMRIRRVNPPEAERALLRAGAQAPARMDTPMSLVAVLRRKLEPGFVLPAAATPPAAALPDAKAPVATASPEPASPKPVGSKPAKPPVAAAPPPPAKPATVKPQPPVKGGTFVQVGAFSTQARAAAVAAKAGGQVSPAGKLFRVRVGPFATRGEAEAALAKAKAAGYSDARIQRAD